MTTNKRIANALEDIASELQNLNVTCRNCNNLNEMVLTNNKEILRANQKHFNLSLAGILNDLIENFGEDTIAYLNAIQEGDLEKAKDIAMTKKMPKKRGRKPQNAQTEIKPEPKKRGRKPKTA